ncbi:MAG: HIT family protein [Salibacteraceae bacterium]
MPSIFTRIAEREIPGYFVAESEDFFAILDINPLQKGHTLVVPKMEVDYIFNLPDELLGNYFQFSKRVAKAIENVVACDRIGVAVVGLEVPHAHIHLIPINNIDDMNFSRPKLSVDKDELRQIAEDISAKFI